MERERIVQAATGIDPRAVEEAVRSIGGVAFAEVRSAPGAGELLRLVFWQDVDAVECARRIGAMLYERFGLTIEPGDVRVVGFATQLAGAPAEAPPAPDAAEPAVRPEEEGAGDARPEEPAQEPVQEEVSVIELEGTAGSMWATERRRPPAPEGRPDREPRAERVPPPDRAPAVSGAGAAPAVGAGPGGPAIERISATEERSEIVVTVTISLGGRLFTGQAGGPPTASRVRRTFCEAALRAVEAALSGRVRLDLDSAAFTDPPDRCALAVVTKLEDGRQDRLTGAALAGDDPKRALVEAALEAVRSCFES